MPLIDLANPTRFLALVKQLLPWLAAATLLAFAYGIKEAIGAPDDYQQGAAAKIMFIHVPSAWLGMGIWATMSVAAASQGRSCLTRARNRVGLARSIRGMGDYVAVL